MEQYATILNIAIPGFMILILVEYLYGKSKGIVTIRSFDTISSLSSGMTNVIKDVLGLTVIIVSYAWLYDHLAIFTLKSTFLIYVLAFIGLDFAGYWTHRFEHVVNVFWNRHVIHHSSEEFNLACALRQNASVIFAIFIFLYLPMAIIGVPPNVVAIATPIHLFAQFWYHTILIDRMGFLEKILVTPSHHRVHHAINEEYLDKNFSQILIIWDKLFGTFQEELKEVKPVYGVKRAASTWNPVIINFQHFWLLLKDAWRTKLLWDKIRIWFMPTGWRPKDVSSKYPVAYVSDPNQMKKYEVVTSKGMVIWSWIQLIINLFLMMWFFSQIGHYTFAHLLLGGAYLFISIFGYTSAMDLNKIAIHTEALRLIWTAVVVYFIGSWYGLSEYLLVGYGIVSLILTSYFLFRVEKYSKS